MAEKSTKCKPLEELLEDLECHVCFESKELQLLPCQHRFCGDCIENMVKNCRMVCPHCRKSFQYPRQGFPVDRLARRVREHVERHMAKSESTEDANQDEPSSDIKAADPPSAPESEANCQGCKNKLDARCSICAEFLCFRCLAMSKCDKKEGDTRHEPVEHQYVVDEADNILSTWRYNVDKELKEINTKKKRKENSLIVEATMDSINSQTNLIERILMIEHITKVFATGASLVPEPVVSRSKAKGEAKGRPKDLSISTEETSRQKLADEIEKRLGKSETQKRASKGKKGKINRSCEISDQAIARYSYDCGGEELHINLVEGEVVTVVAEDPGDGWTEVITSQRESGLVPTAYLDRSRRALTPSTPATPATPERVLGASCEPLILSIRFALYSFSALMT
ncbi:E3 ubiquitin-protein ligase TRIM65-like isoform X2 [Watersipora subatra]|uniref:E3 ubiquitin-protein ligase TRIM65-like isoform X2 n=1 Tax=Watersipora subatra TaxID=2589382 RepID=UPI00355BE18C